jgi:hypothetical protein
MQMFSFRSCRKVYKVHMILIVFRVPGLGSWRNHLCGSRPTKANVLCFLSSFPFSPIATTNVRVWLLLVISLLISHNQGWANLDQAHEDLDRNIFRDLSPTPKP